MLSGVKNKNKKKKAFTSIPRENKVDKAVHTWRAMEATFIAYTPCAEIQAKMLSYTFS